MNVDGERRGLIGIWAYDVDKSFVDIFIADGIGTYSICNDGMAFTCTDNGSSSV